MLTIYTQRWHEGRESYRPAREIIDPRRLEVALISQESEAKSFIRSHHYAKSYPVSRRAFGLYEGAELVGCAVFAAPTNERVLTRVFRGFDPLELSELSRLTLLDRIGANAESFFVARCFAHLKREGFGGVISHADLETRTDEKGNEVKPGHLGIVYAALSGVYLLKTTPRTIRLLPDGQVLSERAIQKIRKRESGWRYAAAQLEAFDATPLSERTDAIRWLTTWLPQLTRRMKHGGCHRYAFGLTRAARRCLPPSYPYPKIKVMQSSLW